MTQQMRVLQCKDCALYQVDIVKKALWQCKVCQLKQAVFDEHFRGTGAECRMKVQELNSARQASDEKDKSDAMALFAKASEVCTQLAMSSPPAAQVVVVKPQGLSKWARYVDAQTAPAKPQPTPLSPNYDGAKRRQCAPRKRSAPAAEHLLNKKNSKWQNYL